MRHPCEGKRQGTFFDSLLFSSHLVRVVRRGGNIYVSMGGKFQVFGNEWTGNDVPFHSVAAAWLFLYFEKRSIEVGLI